MLLGSAHQFAESEVEGGGQTIGNSNSNVHFTQFN
jgi:hypothetical protein